MVYNYGTIHIAMNKSTRPDEIYHYPECENQQEGSPCICDQIEAEAEAKANDTKEAEATGN